MEKQTIGQRIRALRRAKKMTQAQLAKVAGVSSPAVTEWEKDSYLPKAASLEAMANLFQVTTEHLLTGEGRTEPENKIISNVAKVNARMAPVLSWVQAGNWTNIEAVNLDGIDEWLPLPEDECSNCFFLKVQGLSNFPDFLEGDYIVVDPDVYFGDMQSGDMIVVRRGDDATFKKLVIETDGTKYLQALNPEFKPNILAIDEQCIFIGQVVDCIRYVYRARKKARRS